jgi:propanol-preferring alcohol dehydrogenase
MKAMMLEQYGPIEKSPLRLATIARPEPGRGQVVIAVRAVGVCRSNLHMIEGDWPGVPARFPMIPGHELTGVVAEVGDGVESLATGDRVGVQPLWSTCGVCEYCLSGYDQRCPAKQITGETVQGGYAEYMLAESAHVYKVPDNIDDIAAAPLFCPGISAYGAVLKAGLAPARSAAVFGIGGVGHMALQFARLTGAHVTAVTRSAEHQQLAGELGADRVIDSSASDPAAVLSRAGGVDASIVFSPSSASVRQAIDATKPGGTIVVGVAADIGPWPFADEKMVVGSVLGTRQQMHLPPGAGRARPDRAQGRPGPGPRRAPAVTAAPARRGRC